MNKAKLMLKAYRHDFHPKVIRNHVIGYLNKVFDLFTSCLLSAAGVLIGIAIIPYHIARYMLTPAIYCFTKKNQMEQFFKDDQ